VLRHGSHEAEVQNCQEYLLRRTDLSEVRSDDEVIGTVIGTGVGTEAVKTGGHEAAPDPHHRHGFPAVQP
jgi:hypothetical protein